MLNPTPGDRVEIVKGIHRGKRATIVNSLLEISNGQPNKEHIFVSLEKIGTVRVDPTDIVYAMNDSMI